MENISSATSFILTVYKELEDYRYLYFLCFLLAYILTLFVNSVLIVAILTENGLHEPMYLFICSLSVNGVYGSTALLPSILSHLLSRNYEISLSFCLLQIYCLLTYAVIEFTILAVMSYDRYVAICRPLHYHLLMSPKKVYAAIILSCSLPCLYAALYFISAVKLSICDRHMEKAFCMNLALIKRSCPVVTSQNPAEPAFIIICPGPHIVLILFSYAQILRICLFASKESQIKALQTCVPHLLTVIIYSVGSLFEMIQSRYNMSHVPRKTRIFLSIYIVLFPPLFNPIIYGMRIQEIKVQIFKLLGSKVRKHK